MALNLSRNTKVFVSSVNGTGATGGVKTCHVSTPGANFAVGDIVTMSNVGDSNGVDFKVIVASITGGGSTGPVATVNIPNNFRGSAYLATQTDLESATQNSAGTNNAAATGLVITIDSVAGTTTADVTRAGTGKFK